MPATIGCHLPLAIWQAAIKSDANLLIITQFGMHQLYDSDSNSSSSSDSACWPTKFTCLLDGLQYANQCQVQLAIW